jgi:3-phenylpropionate/trans-cinnamate dioxygenase ferredoxin component
MFNYTHLDPSKVDYVAILPANELPPGQRVFVEIGEYQVAVFNIAGEIFAVGDVCTHDNGPLGDGEVEEHEVICPRHGGRFDLRTGKAVSLPAVVDIPAYPVRVVEGKLEVGLPRK